MDTNYYMELAIKQAKKAIEYNEVPIGVILVDNLSNEILVKSHNQVIANKDSTKHAEILAINRASKIKNSRYLSDITMYVTLEPCLMCTVAISESKIKKVYFGAYDEKKGGTEIFLKKNNIYFVPEIYGGILEKECSNLLKNFFILKRDINGKNK